MQCHVAHGSNAQMTGHDFGRRRVPGGDRRHRIDDSRLLKIDNRGTCQACHDPTGTVPAGTIVGAVPGAITPGP